MSTSRFSHLIHYKQWLSNILDAHCGLPVLWKETQLTLSICCVVLYLKLGLINHKQTKTLFLTFFMILTLPNGINQRKLTPSPCCLKFKNKLRSSKYSRDEDGKALSQMNILLGQEPLQVWPTKRRRIFP